MPTEASLTFFPDALVPLFAPDDAYDSQLAVKFAPDLDLASGTILGEIGTTGVYADYASGHSDGTENPVGISEYPIKTDSDGNITNLGDYSTQPTGPMFTEGNFACGDLTGLDSNAVDKLQGRLLQGDTTTGIFHLG